MSENINGREFCQGPFYFFTTARIFLPRGGIIRVVTKWYANRRERKKAPCVMKHMGGAIGMLQAHEWMKRYYIIRLYRSFYIPHKSTDTDFLVAFVEFLNGFE